MHRAARRKEHAARRDEGADFLAIEVGAETLAWPTGNLFRTSIVIRRGARYPMYMRGVKHRRFSTYSG